MVRIIPLNSVAETNFVFLFSPNPNAEVLIQRGNNVGLFELTLVDGKPKPNFIWRMEGVPDLMGNIHSAVRFRDVRYMFLVDDENFYKIDIQTNTTKTYFSMSFVILHI